MKTLVSTKQKKETVVAKNSPVKKANIPATKSPSSSKEASATTTTRAATKKSAASNNTTTKSAPKSIDTKSSNKSKNIHEDLVHKAITALLKHHAESTAENKNTKLSLLGTDVSVQVQFGLEVAPGKAQTKPIRLSIPHALYKLNNHTNSEESDKMDEDNESNLEEPEVCLIVKEDSKEAIQEMIRQFPEHMSCIKKVMGLQSLRTKHAEYKQRRDLLARYTCFMADDRILPMLTSALGNDFLAAKKQPIPIRISRKESLPFAIRKALSATYLHIPEGTCLTVRAGFTHMAVGQLVDNIVEICYQVGDKIPRKWANVRNIAIKLPSSTSLPIYNKTPAELDEIAKLAGVSSAWKSVEEIMTEQQAATAAAQASAAEEDEGESKNKEQVKSKSPLLRALKKTQKAETLDAEVNSSNKKESSTVNGKATDEGATPLSTKKKRKSSSLSTSDNKEAITNNKEKASSSAMPAGETTNAPVNKVIDGEVVASTVEKKRRKQDTTKETKTDDSAPKNSVSRVTKEKSPSVNKNISKFNDNEKPKTSEHFVAAKKFSGSKKGYVFKKGPQGIGYYVDVKPVVNKAAIEALARTQHRSKNSNERSSSSQRGGGRKPIRGGNSGSKRSRSR